MRATVKAALALGVLACGGATRDIESISQARGVRGGEPVNVAGSVSAQTDASSEPVMMGGNASAPAAAAVAVSSAAGSNASLEGLAASHGVGGSAGASSSPHLSHPSRVSLVDHALWHLLDADTDPFSDRPSQIICDPSGAAQELFGGEDAFGVDTGTCKYVTASEATRDYVAEGETLRIRLWHFTLTAPAAAEAHAVVQLDGTTVFEERLPIPAAGALIKREFRAPKAFPAGVPILFHLHNHGDNSWALVEVSTGP